MARDDMGVGVLQGCYCVVTGCLHCKESEKLEKRKVGVAGGQR